jgi:hypothetical protein
MSGTSKRSAKELRPSRRRCRGWTDAKDGWRRAQLESESEQRAPRRVTSRRLLLRSLLADAIPASGVVALTLVQDDRETVRADH